jgi:peptidoglycan hydrolase-like protein with peptidoglycan-binding domain
MRKMRKHIRKAAVATALVAGVAFGGFTAAGTAHAAPDSRKFGYVDGFGATTNDWGDETLKAHEKSNAVYLWQYVLYADGAQYKDEDGDTQTFSEEDISGEFDSVTAAATRDWQKSHKVKKVTGRADQATFAKADNRLGAVAAGNLVTYNGSDVDVDFRRIPVSATNAVYQVQVDGVWVYARY